MQITYSVDPRAGNPSTPVTTGDLVLVAEPRGVPVHFTWEGGGRVARYTTVLKGFLPQTMRVEAFAPRLGMRTAAWVPVKSSCITTVRFRFPGAGDRTAGWRGSYRAARER